MNQSQCGYLEAIRLYELEKVLSIVSEERKKKNGLIILEIGAGTGWQAKKMTELGYIVEAIDIEESNYSNKRIFPIKNYNGKHLPFVDNFFDIVFSSSVLEHISHLEEFQGEMQRVLKPDGIAIHIVPGSVWRIWTSIAHYPFLVKEILMFIYRIILSKDKRVPIESSLGTSKVDLLKKVIFPNRHGEKGNSFSELYYFSKSYWVVMFKKTGWRVKKILPNKLVYTGYMVFGAAISFRLREYLSSLIGSSCHIFILTKD